MSRVSWDQAWMKIADDIAERSACVRRKCGAVIVDVGNRIVATGYNGPAPGFIVGQVDSCREYCPRANADRFDPNYEDCVAGHSESHCLMVRDRSMYADGTIYVTSAVCFGCAKLIAFSGLTRVVMRVLPEDEHRDPKRSIEHLRACGMEVDVWMD